MTLDFTLPLQPQLLADDGPACLMITAKLVPVGETDRFQPAGFPEVGHVIYDAPRVDVAGRPYKEKVCIVDSPASMANHLERVCFAGEGTIDLHSDLTGMPYVRCVTDSEFETQDGQIVSTANSTRTSVVASSLSEGHRLASDYFLDAHPLNNGEPTEATLREQLRTSFRIIEVKKDKTYFIPPATWWNIYRTIFNLDPNSLVHGVMFAKEQIKISRLLTAHMEAFGAARVGRSGVKFDRLQKTTSGQPIFSVDEETAQEIRATFILDLGMLRSYGRGENGLSPIQKQLLLDLAIWKIAQLIRKPFRYRTQCFLQCKSATVSNELGLLPMPLKVNDHASSDSVDDGNQGKENEKAKVEALSASQRLAESLFSCIQIATSITNCNFTTGAADVYYPANELFKPGKDTAASDSDDTEDDVEEETN